MLKDYIAASIWQPIKNAPKDGTSILLLFKSGYTQVCHWATWPVGGESPQVYGGQTVVQGSPPDKWEEGWVVTGCELMIINEEPVAWAKIFPENWDEDE